MSITVNGTTGLNFPDGTSQPTAGFVPFRNRIINGDMRIDQRWNGAAVTNENYLVDRWRVWFNQSYSLQQVTDAPAGFSRSLRATKTNTTQSTYAYFIHYVEGFNFADMGFGTANASPVTLSFWVKSSVTGAFTAGIGNATGGVGSASTLFYPASYTISSTNTWEYKTITIPGRTTGTWNGSTNSAGVSIYFNFGGTGTATANTWNTGDVQVASTANANLGTTNNATFQITGVQLEKGSSATAFEYRPFGVEFSLCQRYFEKSYPIDRVPGSVTGTTLLTGIQASSQYAAIYAPFKVEKRAAPTAVVYNPSTGTAGQMIADATNITNPSVGVNVFGIYAHCNGQTTSINQFLNMHYAVSAEL